MAMTVHRINSVVVETDDEDTFFDPLNEAFDLHLSADGRAFVSDMKARIEAGEVRYDDLTNMTAEEPATSIAEGCEQALDYYGRLADEAEAGETIDVTDMTREERRALRHR